MRAFLLIFLIKASIALESCQLDETTIKDGECFIENQCYSNGDPRQANDVTSDCQICDPSKSQTIWSVKAGFSASVADPPNDCSEIPKDTYQSCKIPSFEWASYSTRTTARMYPMKGAVAGDYLFAGGYLKSTIDFDTEESRLSEDFIVSGPFSVNDPTGLNAKEISADLTSYSAKIGARENAGGTFGQYDVGIVKIDIKTGEPEDVFLYYGQGLDEASGLAASGDMLAISGHFTGNLTAGMADGSLKTIHNSNLMEDGTPNPDDQFHPNSKDSSGETGSDDGFVIKANTETGKASWMLHYPISNKDSQIIGVDMDAEGNVYGAGYKCTQEVNTTDPKVCDGLIAKFASADGKVIWEKTFTDLGAVFWIKYDTIDSALYFTGTTTYGGTSKDTKNHSFCSSDACAVAGRASADNGSTSWIRTVPGSPRWGVFDQSGDIEIAPDTDGPFVYVAFDDVGEGGPVKLDAGTSYAGCKSISNGEITPEYEVSTAKLVLSSDCPEGTTFVGREDEDALPASSAATGAHCGSRGGIDACLIKYHKHTGLPIWGVDLPPIAAVVPSPDGKSIMATGWYYNARGKGIFDSVTLPGYLREGGLGSQRSGIYNAQLLAQDGSGEYVLHSGGGSKDRLYDAVGDSAGNVYNIGYSMNLVMNWGGTLTTKMEEVDVLESDAGSDAKETHFLVSKLAAGEAATPSCLSSCTDTTATASVKEDSCFIDGVCYESGGTAVLFGKGCFVCDPTKSQTEWSTGEVTGASECFIDDICVVKDDYLFTQRRTWAAKTYSECQYCNPSKDTYGWSVKDGFTISENGNIPNDCEEKEDVPELCFSGKNTIEVLGRGLVTMDTLNIGDSVLVQGGKYSKVYSFGHYDPNTLSKYLQIKSDRAKSPLEITEDHMVFIKDELSIRSVPASSIMLGDMLISPNGYTSEVSDIKYVLSRGAYAPFTLSGDIVVSNIVSSNYVALISEEDTVLPISMHWIAHAFKAPHRLACSFVSFDICKNETYNSNGHSNWITTPLRAGKWLVRQVPILQNSLIIMLVFYLLFVSLVETIMNIHYTLLFAALAFGFIFLQKKVPKEI